MQISALQDEHFLTAANKCGSLHPRQATADSPAAAAAAAAAAARLAFARTDADVSGYSPTNPLTWLQQRRRESFLGACLARAGEFSAARGRPPARSSTCSRRRSCLRKNGPLFEWFPYVCPEPVLVKCSVLYINGSKRPFLLTVLCHRVVPLPERHPPATIPHNHTQSTHTHNAHTHTMHTQRTHTTHTTHATHT
jgi:hypothetical protein